MNVQKCWNCICFIFDPFIYFISFLFFVIVLNSWIERDFNSINIFSNHELKICIRSCDSCSYFICLKCSINLFCMIGYKFKVIMIKTIQTYINLLLLEDLHGDSKPSLFANSQFFNCLIKRFSDAYHRSRKWIYECQSCKG